MVREGVRLHVGAIFGRLTVLKIAPYVKYTKRVKVRCACGKEFWTYSTGLYSKETQSCGCYHKERVTRHGHSYHPLFIRWQSMIWRCYKPTNRSYKNYGARGITVCDRWRDSFEAFVEDMGIAPVGKSLERIDNNGPYCKENCKWATDTEQTRNQRTNVRYEMNGELLTIPEWAERFGMPKATVYNRVLKLHWPLLKALTTKVSSKHRRNKKGNTHESGS